MWLNNFYNLSCYTTLSRLRFLISSHFMFYLQFICKFIILVILNMAARLSYADYFNVSAVFYCVLCCATVISINISFTLLT
jgi:hypothetical protein